MEMTNHEFRAIRQRLGLTQAELAAVLGYAHVMTVSAYERETNPRPIPTLLSMVMQAMDGGWLPDGWPK